MWAQDFLAEHPNGSHIINDSWTPSGPMHIGTFRSMIIHDVLQRILRENHQPVTYWYGYDDFDPMDDIPVGLTGYEEHLGKPLVNIPPTSKKFASLADEFIDQNKQHHQTLGVVSKSYRTSELYRSGKFNEAIVKVLDNAAKIRTIYQEVSGSKRPQDWYPIQVICPNCGKLGSTIVNGWDGEEVSFECQPNLVSWAKGCGYVGKSSPLNGQAKMTWRVEWAAKWDLFDVTIEAAGKDHTSRGGSFDTGSRILKEVFGKDPIAAFGHEMFNIDGKKMSSSKGLVVTPEQVLNVFEPQIFRFLLVRTRPQQAIEIDLSRIVPATYDEYDRCQKAYLEKTGQDLSDYFYYSQINPTKVDGQVKTRFSTVVNLVQLPSLRDELNLPEIAPRIIYARHWLDHYAPTEARFTVQSKLPEAVKSLSTKQREFLRRASELIGEQDEESLQTKLYDLSKEIDLPTKDAFAAIYLSLIGKPSGPRAGVLIVSQPQVFVRKRFAEAAT